MLCVLCVRCSSVVDSFATEPETGPLRGASLGPEHRMAEDTDEEDGEDGEEEEQGKVHIVYDTV